MQIDSDRLTAAVPGRSKVMKELRDRVAMAATTSIPVLVVGELGSGKSTIARTIHDLSDRSGGRFVTVNCAGLSPELLRAELFGVEQGAYTGAQARVGMFETARGGTIVLDEIDSLPRELHGVVVRALEQRVVRRLGGEVDVPIDARVIAATGVTEPGRFANAAQFPITITVPPLRERISDLSLLSLAVADAVSRDLRRPIKIDRSAITLLSNYHFPGNVRELRVIIESGAVGSKTGVIAAPDVRPYMRAEAVARRRRATTADLREEIASLRDALSHLRTTTIEAVPIWRTRNIGTETDYCFVLMPLRRAVSTHRAYFNSVKPTITKLGLRCERADDIYTVEGVMESVWACINRARIVIADLTGRNANVFYELGIAHTLGKPVIMLTQAIEDVPFDLRHLRCIVYRYTPEGARALEEALERTIRTVLSETSGSVLTFRDQRYSG